MNEPEPRHDHSMVTTMMILELLAEQPDAPKYVIASRMQQIVYTALESFERDIRGRTIVFSDN